MTMELYFGPEHTQLSTVSTRSMKSVCWSVLVTRHHCQNRVDKTNRSSTQNIKLPPFHLETIKICLNWLLLSQILTPSWIYLMSLNHNQLMCLLKFGSSLILFVCNTLFLQTKSLLKFLLPFGIGLKR